MSEKKYKWPGPQEWLLDKIDEWPPQEVATALRLLILKSTADDIQDIFQSDMQADGYFTPICQHEHLDFDGICKACGEDRRRG